MSCFSGSRRGSEPSGPTRGQGVGLAIPLGFLTFSRGFESEADVLGLQYMYKAGYDPNAYVTFFAKIIDQDRRSPGSVPTIFASHPQTPERILKSEEEIKEILPKREQYLVSTSEFEDIKARLQSVISVRKKGEKKEGPTLRKREVGDRTGSETETGKPSEDQGEEKPPVLRRRD